MGADRWVVRNALFGVMLPDVRYPYSEQSPGQGALVGLVRRTGDVRALGHFCSVDISVAGKRRIAQGAESRVWPFHSFVLDVGEPVPVLDYMALGWCRDRNTYAFIEWDAALVKGALQRGGLVHVTGQGPTRVAPLPGGLDALGDDARQHAASLAGLAGLMALLRLQRPRNTLKALVRRHG